MLEGHLVTKVWGSEKYITSQQAYTGKWLHVYPYYICSLHRHPIKEETFYVIGGNGVIVKGEKIIAVGPGSTVHILPGTLHCFATATGMTLLEISTRHDDSDVERVRESARLSPIVHKEVWEALGL